MNASKLLNQPFVKSYKQRGLRLGQCTSHGERPLTIILMKSVRASIIGWSDVRNTSSVWHQEDELDLAALTARQERIKCRYDIYLQFEAVYRETEKVLLVEEEDVCRMMRICLVHKVMNLKEPWCLSERLLPQGGRNGENASLPQSEIWSWEDAVSIILARRCTMRSLQFK